MYAISGVMQLGILVQGFGDEAHDQLLSTMEKQFFGPQEGVTRESGEKEIDKALSPMGILLDEFQTLAFDTPSAKQSCLDQT